MKYYIVKLNILLGEYEKSSIHLVNAENDTSAILKALQGESHHDDAGDVDGTWMDGDMNYKVSSAHVVDTADVATLKHYL